MEKIHEKPERSREKLLTDYDKKFADTTEISLQDLREMKEHDISVEEFLDFLIKKHGYLLHGSREKISAQKGLRANLHKIYATDRAAIAIMRAIYSNRESMLEYPYTIDESSPLELVIHNQNPHTIGEKGYIYVLPRTDDFINDPPKSWQYIKNGNDENFLKRIEVEKRDFKYSVKIAK